MFSYSVFNGTHHPKKKKKKKLVWFKNLYFVFIFSILKIGFEYKKWKSVYNTKKKKKKTFSVFSFSYKMNTVAIL